MEVKFRLSARWSCVLAVMGVAALAQAQVYKCPDAQGKISYQQTPCESGAPQGKAKGEPPAPTLASANPESRVIDQCVKLHEFRPNNPADFRSHSATYAPTGDGSWLVVIAGTAVKEGARVQETLRCPATGTGAINLDLWRAQAVQGSVESNKQVEANPSARSSATAAASPAGKDKAAIANAGKAGDRKSIESRIRGSRLGEEQVRQALGDPDARGSVLGTCLLPVSRTPYACRLQTWIYLPTALDPQTRTTITFSQDGVAAEVARAIQY